MRLLLSDSMKVLLSHRERGRAIRPRAVRLYLFSLMGIALWAKSSLRAECEWNNTSWHAAAGMHEARRSFPCTIIGPLAPG